MAYKETWVARVGMGVATLTAHRDSQDSQRSEDSEDSEDEQRYLECPDWAVKVCGQAHSWEKRAPDY